MGHQLIDCHILHQRFSPKKHGFNTKFFWFDLEIMELDSISKKVPLISVNTSGAYQFNEHSHLPLGGKTLRENVITLLEKNNETRTPSSIRLLTNLKFFGYLFNPISLFLITFEGGDHCAIIEIGNTFNEIKPYFVSSNLFTEGGFEYSCPKNFYISPFLAHDNQLHFKFRWTEQGFTLDIDDYEEDQLVLITRMRSSFSPLSSIDLIKKTIAFPFSTIRTISLIHYHAFLLWMKKIRYYKKNEFLNLQQGALPWRR